MPIASVRRASFDYAAGSLPVSLLAAINQTPLSILPMTSLLLLALALGFATGLRSFVAPAALAWGVHFGWLSLDGTWLQFLHSPVALALLTLCAVGELIGDKLPIIPARITAGPLGFRIVAGAVAGAGLALAHGGAVWLPIFAGIAGALAGAFGGYFARRYLTRHAKLPDLPVALLEDALALGLAFFAVTR